MSDRYLEKRPEPIATTPAAPPMSRSSGRAGLAKDPADRYQAAHDVAMDLRWMADSATGGEARPSRKLKKSWAILLAAAVVVLVGLAVLGGFWWAKHGESGKAIHAEIPPPDKFSFDPTAGRLSGSPVPLISNVRYDSGVWRSIFAVSQNGLMVYQTGSAAAAGTRLVWIDRSGKQIR